MDAGVIVAFAFGYLVTALAAFLLYSPVMILFVVLLLTAGALRLLVWPLQLLVRKLRRHQKDEPTEQPWLFGAGGT